MHILPYKLILGSKSPRRVELLSKSGLEFEQRVIETDESYPPDLAIEKIAEHIAIAKAEAHKASLIENEVILTADTIVVQMGRVYGKPSDYDDAFNTLQRLSDSKHEVYTGVCLLSLNKIESFSALSEVYFSALSKEEIDWYIRTFEPYDKAGSYGIQDWIGTAKITEIKGSYSNILGLPMGQVYERLMGF